MTHEQRTQALNEFRLQVEAEGQQYLGEAGFYNYRNRGGEWLTHWFE